MDLTEWACLAKNYFGKTRSWIYHKFSGTEGVGDDFSDVDKEQLKYALYDISRRNSAAADRL